MKETVLNFGPAGALVGIVTRPGATQEGAPIAVVFLNAGVIHRVGPGRLHVRLARTLAAHGVVCFRFDLPGIGDSRTLGTGGMLLQENLTAVRAALDILERRGIARQFVIFGLCSGADHAFVAACYDPRIVGIVMVDPTRIFTTWKSHALRAWRWLVRPSAWLRLVLGHYQLFRHLAQRVRPALEAPSAIQQTPASPQVEKRAVEAALRNFVQRGVRICYLITGTQRHHYNYRNQLRDAFPGIGLEEITHVEIMPDAIHTLPREEERVRLEQILLAWLEAGFVPGPAPMPVVVPVPAAGAEPVA